MTTGEEPPTVSHCTGLAIIPTDKYLDLFLYSELIHVEIKKSYRDPFRINSSSEEGGLPSIHIFLTLTGQLQLTIVLINIPVDTAGLTPNTQRCFYILIRPGMCCLSSCRSESGKSHAVMESQAMSWSSVSG